MECSNWLSLALLSYKGLQWSLLNEDEVIPRILAMEGRRGHPPKPEHQRRGDEGPRSRRSKGRLPNVGEADFPGATDAKLLRKLEAQGGFSSCKNHGGFCKASVTYTTMNAKNLSFCCRDGSAGSPDQDDEET